MRVGVIGTGHIARQHLSCLRELAGVEIAAVCDLSRGLAEAAAERFGVPRWFTDSRTMLDEIRPDVVHVTTPPTSHYRLASDAIQAGSHVLVEKPITVSFDEVESLLDQARDKNRALIEDYNYVFNKPVQRLLNMIESGEFGHVVHVEVLFCLDILAKGNPFCDPNAPHPCLTMPGGAIADFLPHLASLAHAFVGPHRGVRSTWRKRSDSPLPSDEFQAMVNAERGTAALGFSAHAQPDVFWLRVYGTKMRAAANLFETRLTIERTRGGPKPLVPLFNSLDEARAVRRSAFGSLVRKLSGGPGAYEGLWALLTKTYEALNKGGQPPVSSQQIQEVNRLIDDLKKPEYQF
ncbi:MAG TPA: Gfo/Idh/MocA family oxidoreductase [Tepidisphaeraceae bacterium]|nr:Gfo/Idh/MocA family oxidoreductase [Tepidisphaeraceae bacterium]